jgi:hypothetical protein
MPRAYRTAIPAPRAAPPILLDPRGRIGRVGVPPGSSGTGFSGTGSLKTDPVLTVPVLTR